MTTITLKEGIVNPLRLEDYDVSQQCGFLPIYSPAEAKLPDIFWQVQKTVALLPKWVATGKIRQVIKNLLKVDVERETLDQMQLRRAMQIYSYLTHAYVWGEATTPKVLPHNIAIPFYQISQRLGRPPVLSYASYTLDNWVRIHETEPMEIGNIMVWQNFSGGLDEDWFILIHIEIEAKAAPALAAIPNILQGIAQGDTDMVIAALEDIKQAWININATMSRMPEACDPYIYYNRVRPYLYAWKNNPALPEGLIYEGVEAYGEEPQQFRGSTGAQSTIVPIMDALFNIAHEGDPLWEYLIEMRGYMPPKHRAFVEEVEKRSTLRDFIKNRMDRVPKLKDLYNDCVSLIEQFRTQHLKFAARYINQQTAKSNNDTEIGTGGTPFMQYLKKHRDENNQHLL
ncbi:MAG: indoleamine 2,3-dioxygenase [Mojavia pulchra JT2-VF2]|jgi:indoleamine 2,3-dioxygenase|uniref:Indoleamine 2,3-dioxygenase n=1 Tax=Mojavia pulchra JT2-VF2 TaxID=287848 RepID=A0A951UGY2_9NOST|nr:indoleamine 2,3-dioxygenase [Mojavia pulchra JT2-VF2]